MTIAKILPHISTLILIFTIVSVVASTPVCIVGAGPAGLAAAHSLETKGHEVVIFDKQGNVGGKCQAVYDKDTFHPLGALLFTNGTYQETLKIINSVDVPAKEFLDGEPTWQYDWRTGSIQRAPSFTAPQVALLATEIARYTLQWTTDFVPFSSVGYKSGVPEEFTLSTADWLAKYNYQILPVLFNLGMFSYGYGDLRTVPVLYMLQYYHPDVVTAFANVTPGYIIDFHKVFEQYSKTIKGPIILNAAISKIDRTASPTITYRSKNGQSKQQSCSDLILAFPPTVSALEAANLDLTKEERELFSAVQLSQYFSSAVSLTVPPNELYFANSTAPNVPPEAAGQPVGVLRLNKESNITTVWSWAKFGTVVTEQRSRQLLKETLSRINKDPVDTQAVGVSVLDSDIKGFTKPEYFPQVSSVELLNGWYKRFNSIQGNKKTYFASGLNAFETVEFAVRAGQDIVVSYL